MKTKSNLAYVGKKKGKRDSNSWYTPPIYIESARAVMGSIDLDPFSSSKANETVKASYYLDEKDDAFTSEWDGKHVWMNPPYGVGIMSKAIDRFVEMRSNFDEAIVLVNNATETKWFKKLLDISSGICLVNKRIAFLSPDNKNVSGNTRGQVFFYVGDNLASFAKEFKQYGTILKGVYNG